MRARITSFRGGLRTRREREVILRPLEEFPRSLVGKRVIWINPHSGSRFVGVVVAPHGSKHYRARFKVGLPGWAIGGEVEIL